MQNIYGRFHGGGGSFQCKVGDFSVLAVFLKNVGGGMLYLFEISKKWPVQKGMGLGGGG